MDKIKEMMRFGISSEEFLKQYTVPFQMDQDGVPGPDPLAYLDYQEQFGSRDDCEEQKKP